MGYFCGSQSFPSEGAAHGLRPRRASGGVLTP